MSSSSSNSEITSYIKELEHLRIPFQEIKEATKNFTTPIAKGGYGLVYKAELLLSGMLTVVAVKRLDNSNISGQGLKEFLTEIQLLSRYKHENLVSLLGFCEEHGEKIIVYDYAEHGSLDKYLTTSKSTTLPLTWTQRINICIDAARGLHHLHNHVAEDHRVIHRDIKSGNILLGQDWKAMIADFGLSKIGSTHENDTFIITNASGTHGYCDPAYLESGILTKESDVYSFGVVLFEVLCGRLSIINVNTDQRVLAPLAQRCYEEGSLDDIIDPYLKTHVDSDSLHRFSEIAYWCLCKDRKERPSIGLVVQKLKEITITTHDIGKAHENIDKTLNAANEILNKFDLSHEDGARRLGVPHKNLEDYNHKINGGSMAISELEHEFKHHLSLYSKPVEPNTLYACLPSLPRPSSGSPDANNKSHTDNVTIENAYNTPVLIPPRVMPLLHDLAQQMVNAGHTHQCLIIYRDTRSQVLQESLHQLGVPEKLSNDDVQKIQWEVKLLFAAERKVCDQLFEGVESLKDQCFAEVTKGSVGMLFSFGVAVAKSKRSPEKLFALLDMYEIMCELHSEIETLFSGKACKETREVALGLTKRLAQTAKDTFGDFEEAVKNDATRTDVADVTVHSLTSYVIDYVKCLSDHQSTLKQLFQEFEKEDDSNTQMASVTTRIMQALQTNLEGKSKQYNDPTLTNLFLMNNTHYMVQSVRRSESKDLLGDDWVARHRKIVQHHANQYRRVAWAKILQCLSIQEAGSLGIDMGKNSMASRALVKKRLKIFNLQFKELHQTQSQWTVPDSELRESLRLAVAEVLLPAYRSFIERYGFLVKNGKHSYKYIKYSGEDLDRMLREFFNGKT